MIKKLLKNKRGFTLVELMVAISIIGILSAIVYANFDGARKAARDDIRKTDLKNLQLAIELYKAQNGEYPPPGCGGGSLNQDDPSDNPGWTGPHQPTTPAANFTQCDEYIDGLIPDYLPALPRDPGNLSQNTSWGRGYLYTRTIDRKSYKLLAFDSVESRSVTTADDFARCQSSCSAVTYPVCANSTVPKTYAVYGPGGQCW